MSLNQEHLEKMGCQSPGCDHQGHGGEPFHFHPRCHPGAGADVAYIKGRGFLSLVCHKCKKPVVEIEVAP